MDWDVWKGLTSLHEGVRKERDSFKIDLIDDFDDDIVRAVISELHESRIFGNVYWFGYKFEDSVPSNVRTHFTRWVKGLEEDKPSEVELRQFIEQPLALLNKKIPLSNFDGFVYPVSGRSQLVSKIIQIVGNYLQHNIENISFEIIKTLPSNVEFDFDAFSRDVDNSMKYRDSERYIRKELLPKIRRSDYFSIGEVKPKYRKYMRDYLRFSSQKVEQSFSAIEKGNILVVDDIDTTKATLQEILRIINRINPNCNVYIFTLIGKE